MTSYCSADDLRTQLRIPDPEDDPYLDGIRDAVSRAIDSYTNRRFDPVTADTVASARVYAAGCDELVEVDDIGSATDLAIATDDQATGTFSTLWATSDFQTEPLNALADGRAIYRLRVRGTSARSFPTYGAEALVQVTAKWGWPVVPAPIRTACLLEAARIAKRRDAPFGVIAAPDFAAPERLLAAFDPDTKKLMDPYRKHPFGI